MYLIKVHVNIRSAHLLHQCSDLVTQDFVVAGIDMHGRPCLCETCKVGVGHNSECRRHVGVGEICVVASERGGDNNVYALHPVLER